MEIKKINSKCNEKESQLTSKAKQLDKDTAHWKKQIRILEEEQEKNLKVKEALLDEVYWSLKILGNLHSSFFMSGNCTN